MSHKPHHIQLIDKYLMAPWRYMDPDGHSPSAGWFKNVLHLPETKALALSGVAVAALSTSVKTTAAALIVSGSILLIKNLASGAGANQLASDEDEAAFYIDTDPVREPTLKTDARLLVEENTPPLYFSVPMSMITPVASVLTLQWINSSHFGEFGSINFHSVSMGAGLLINSMSNTLAYHYRMNRVLDEHWECIYKTPLIEPEGEKEMALGSPIAAGPMPIQTKTPHVA